MTEVDILGSFIDLFGGRDDAYGSDFGSCVREPVTPTVWLDHIGGQRPIGIYPLKFHPAGWVCRWGMVDIDVNDYTLANNLRLALNGMGMVGWVEQSRSKGWHVWLFSYGWVPAKLMREALLAACQVISYEPKEVNPKSDGEGQGPEFMSNYCRLPYPGHGALGRQVVVDLKGDPYTMKAFLQLARDPARRATLERLQEAAALYVPAPPKAAVAIEQYSGEMEDLRKRLSGIANTIFLQGPLEGSDRSSTLVKLVHKIRESGLTAGEALVLLRDADRRFGKYYLRSDAERQYAYIIQSVYG